MSQPRRAIPESRARTMRRGAVAIGSVLATAIVVQITVNGGWARIVDSVTHPEPKVVINTDPIPFTAETRYKGVLIPDEAGEIGDPPDSGYDADIKAWAYPMGGIDSPVTVTQITVTSPDAAILVTDLKIRVLNRTTSSRGSHVGVKGAGGAYLRSYYVDLDQPNPVAEKDGEDGPWDFPISLGSDDTYIADVMATATNSDVTWDIEIVYLSEGVERVATISPSGNGFRTTGKSNATRYWVWGGSDAGWTDGAPPP